ncbi:MAG: cytochrome c biogenesis protein CcsA [Thermoanaerobaculia bacterium]
MISFHLALYATIVFYGAATVSVFISLFNRDEKLQKLGLGLVATGFVTHTVWIGSICSRTLHPPLTNLPETTAFIGWLVVVAQLFLYFRYRVYAASFFVYPLLVILITVPAIVRDPLATMDPALRSNVFIGHLLLTMIGLAALLIGLAFTILYQVQERAIRLKRRGRLYQWIPSLRVCDVLGYRLLASGFVIYTLGLGAGILWSYRTTAGAFSLRAKEIGALTAWVMFAAILQTYISGSQRARRVLILSAFAFISITIALLGIQHV